MFRHIGWWKLPTFYRFLLHVSCGYVNVLYYTSGVEQNEAAALSTVLTEAEMTYALRVQNAGHFPRA